MLGHHRTVTFRILCYFILFRNLKKLIAKNVGLFKNCLLSGIIFQRSLILFRKIRNIACLIINNSFIWLKQILKGLINFKTKLKNFYLSNCLINFFNEYIYYKNIKIVKMNNKLVKNLIIINKFKIF
jgi:hypothetical protein